MPLIYRYVATVFTALEYS